MFVGLSSCNGNFASSVLVFEAQQIQLTMPMNIGRWTSRYVAMNGGKWCVPRTTKSNNNNEKKGNNFWHSCLSLYHYLSIPFSFSLYLCCVCLSKASHTMLIVAFVAFCLFTCLAFVVVVALVAFLLLLLCAGVCNAIKVSLHIYLAISSVIIFGISNVFLLLCVSFKWSSHTHTQAHAYTYTYKNEFIGFSSLSFFPLASLCLAHELNFKLFARL